MATSSSEQQGSRARGRRPRRPRVLLLSMPYGALERPALGISLLKSEVRASGFACDVRYLAFAFAEFVGADEYRWIQSELPHVAFAGDWTFARALGERDGAEAGYIEFVLRRTWGIGDDAIARLLRARAYAEHF